MNEPETTTHQIDHVIHAGPDDDMRSEFLDKSKAFFDFASDFVARFPQHKINIKLWARLGASKKSTKT